MTDGQANRAASSGRGGFRVLGLALLCLLAGAAGGLSYAAWNAWRAPVTKEADGLKRASEEQKRDYVPASELGIRGKMRYVKYPAGYKLRIVHQLWANGKFERNEAEDFWLLDPNTPGRLLLGVKTYDPSVLARDPAARDPGREIRVTFCRGPEYREGWYEMGRCGGRLASAMDDSPLELPAEWAGGYYWLVSWVAIGDTPAGFLGGTRVHAAEDFKDRFIGLYAAVSVQLARLTPEDRNAPISDLDKSFGFVSRPFDPNEASR